MAPQFYLIAPPDAAAANFAAMLAPMLAATPVAALLLPRGARDATAYAAFVTTVAPVAQAAGCAVLIEGEPALVRKLGADGLHVAGPLAEVKAALAALKPDLIVGTAVAESRHEAMARGELGLDYIMFGPISGAIAPASRDLAGWWAETMEIPAVLCDPEATATTADAAGCEFLALSDSLWRTPDPIAELAAIATRLGPPQ